MIRERAKSYGNIEKSLDGDIEVTPLRANFQPRQTNRANFLSFDVSISALSILFLFLFLFVRLLTSEKRMGSISREEREFARAVERRRNTEE